MKGEMPYSISEGQANDFWKRHREEFNQYDVLITSDTVSLSYGFLLNLSEVKPFLIILNCNRFNYGMAGEDKFHQLLRMVQSDAGYLKKVLYLPYTDFERVWCGKHGIYLHERAVMPLGKYVEHINDKGLMEEYFKTTDTSRRTKDIGETVFLQRYYNHSHFMNLRDDIASHDISVDIGSYHHLHELHPYKALVVLPDQFSKYFTFESIQEEVVVILPSMKFLMELVPRHGYFFNIEGSGGRLTNEYINLCEWYKYPEARIYFDSFGELMDILKNLTPEKIAEVKKWCRFYGKVIESEHLLQWKHILEKVELHRSG